MTATKETREGEAMQGFDFEHVSLLDTGESLFFDHRDPAMLELSETERNT